MLRTVPLYLWILSHLFTFPSLFAVSRMNLKDFRPALRTIFDSLIEFDGLLVHHPVILKNRTFLWDWGNSGKRCRPFGGFCSLNASFLGQVFLLLFHSCAGAGRSSRKAFSPIGDSVC